MNECSVLMVPFEALREEFNESHCESPRKQEMEMYFPVSMPESHAQLHISCLFFHHSTSLSLSLSLYSHHVVDVSLAHSLSFFLSLPPFPSLSFSQLFSSTSLSPLSLSHLEILSVH